MIRKTLENICLAGMTLLASCSVGEFKTLRMNYSLSNQHPEQMQEEEGFDFLFFNAAHVRGNTDNTLKIISREESINNARLLGRRIKEEGIDVAGFAELDYPTSKTGWVDQPLEIVKEMDDPFNYLVVDQYLKSSLWTTGNAMISKFPLRVVHRHLYGDEEPFPRNRIDYFFKDFIHVEAQIGSRKVNFVLTHFDDSEKDFRRVEQAREYAGYIKMFKKENPESIIIAAGDYNSGKGSRPIGILLSTKILFPPKNNFGMKTYQNGNPTKDLSHILATDNVEIQDFEVFHYPYSDHLGVKAYIKFKE